MSLHHHRETSGPLPNAYCMQGAQLEPQLGSTKFALVVLELLVLSSVIMVISLSISLSAFMVTGRYYYVANAFLSVLLLTRALW